MRSAMPRVSLHQSPFQAPPPPTPTPITLYPRRRIPHPSTFPPRASTTMPATPQAPPYRPIRLSYRPSHASPRSSTSLCRPTVPNTPPVSTRQALEAAAAVTWHRTAACSPRPKGHRAICLLAMRTSRSLRAQTLEALPRARIDQHRTCHRRLNPHHRLRHVPSHPHI
jgi:hypothetical protein